jgi:hypothetical protein
MVGDAIAARAVARAIFVGTGTVGFVLGKFAGVGHGNFPFFANKIENAFHGEPENRHV